MTVAAPQTPVATWPWLLGRTPGGAWRHAPFLAPTPGQGQDPQQEPRVEVIHRLIAYPQAPFDQVIQALAAAERAEREVRWVCFREPGTLPARPYWVCFVSATPSGRRFHVGLELFDRERLGLWFFSGYQSDKVPPELVTPFPSRPDLLLPRLELDGGPPRVPVGEWITAAWEDRLAFAGADGAVAPRGTGAYSRHTDQSHALQASILAIEPDSQTLHPLLGLRASRVRLMVFPPGGEPQLHPLARLRATIGRDPRSDVVVDHPSVSKEHARLDWTAQGPALTDLSSKNGTGVGGTRLVPEKPRPIPGEAEVLIGAVPALLFSDAERPEGAPHPHLARLDGLVQRGKLTPEARQAAEGEAAQHGVGPAEVALLRGWIKRDDWTIPAGGGGCAGLLLLGAAALALAGCALG